MWHDAGRLHARARRLPFAVMALCLFSSWSRGSFCLYFEQICAETSSQSSLPFTSFKHFWWVWGSNEYLSTDLVSVWQCQLVAAYNGGSCSWRCHGYLPSLAWGAKAPCHSSRHQFLSSPVRDEFNNNCRSHLSAMAAIKMPVIQYYNNFKPFCKSNQFYYFRVFLVRAHNNYLLLT